MHCKLFLTVEAAMLNSVSDTVQIIMGKKCEAAGAAEGG